MDSVVMPDKPRQSTDTSRGVPFTDGGVSTDDWTDIQLSEPGAGTWDIDLHLERGTVRTVVLRFHPTGLAGIVNSLLSDLDDGQVRNILTRVVERQVIDPTELVPEEGPEE